MEEEVDVRVGKLTFEETYQTIAALWERLSDDQRARFYRAHRTEFENLALKNPW